jgi:hypothetical protein
MRARACRRPSDRRRRSVALLARRDEKSAREGHRVLRGSPAAVKWRNFKVHFYRQDTMISPAEKLGIPLLFNLYTNPQEDENEPATDSWVGRSGAEGGRRVRGQREGEPADPDGHARSLPAPERLKETTMSYFDASWPLPDFEKIG